MDRTDNDRTDTTEAGLDWLTANVTGREQGAYWRSLVAAWEAGTQAQRQVAATLMAIDERNWSAANIRLSAQRAGQA